jgi:ribosomal protein S18 acetylase RimI-like enzyme
VNKYLYIHDIIVQKEYRRFGIGRKLMEKCVAIAKERDYCKVYGRSNTISGILEKFATPNPRRR